MEEVCYDFLRVAGYMAIFMVCMFLLIGFCIWFQSKDEQRRNKTGSTHVKERRHEKN